MGNITLMFLSFGQGIFNGVTSLDQSCASKIFDGLEDRFFTVITFSRQLKPKSKVGAGNSWLPFNYVNAEYAQRESNS